MSEQFNCIIIVIKWIFSRASIAPVEGNLIFLIPRSLIEASKSATTVRESTLLEMVFNV